VVVQGREGEKKREGETHEKEVAISCGGRRKRSHSRVKKEKGTRRFARGEWPGREKGGRGEIPDFRSLQRGEKS